MYDEAFWEGVTFEEFLDGVKANRELWHPVAARARVAREAVDRARGLPGHWRLLVIADDWCGDAVNILPVVAGLADAVDDVELRIIGRELRPELMDRHLTNGSRSIPVIILLDDNGRCRGWWGPRPRALQEWFEAEGRPLPKRERYRELRRRYARDRGTSIAEEIVSLLACAGSPTAGDAESPPAGDCRDAGRPCAERVAA